MVAKSSEIRRLLRGRKGICVCGGHCNERFSLLPILCATRKPPIRQADMDYGRNERIYISNVAYLGNDEGGMLLSRRSMTNAQIRGRF